MILLIFCIQFQYLFLKQVEKKLPEEEETKASYFGYTNWLLENGKSQ